MTEQADEDVETRGRRLVDEMVERVACRSDSREITADLVSSLATPAVALLWSQGDSPLMRLLIVLRGVRGLARPVDNLRRYLDDTVKRARRSAADGGGPEVDANVWPQLAKGEGGAPLASLRNLQLILSDDHRQRGRTRYNEFGRRVEYDSEPIADHVEGEVAIWVEAIYGMRCSVNLVHEALAVVAHRDPYNPVRTYLEGLEWDGEERLDGMLSTYFGVEPTDDCLDATMGRSWMIGAVARALQPGCKMDTVLVLRGEQGANKSTAFESLVPERDWFSDSPVNIGHVDGFQVLSGSWIVELAELDALSKKEMSTVKAFITSRVDKYRPSYGRNPVMLPRQCVLAGTVNGDLVIRDPTGSRRFWVRAVANAMDVAGLRRVRDQLWAEAVHRFRAGERWWLDRPDEHARADDAEQYQQTDPWEGPVLEWLDRRIGDVTTADVAAGALKIETRGLDRPAEMRIAAILRGAGWTLHRQRRGGVPFRVWRCT